MFSVALGPLAIPVYPALIILSLFVFKLLTHLFTRGTDSQSASSDRIFRAALYGFLSARIAFVISMWNVYQNDWLAIINIRDGGFIGYYGWTVAAAVLIFSSRRDNRALSAYAKSASITAIIVLPLFLATIFFNQGRKLPGSLVMDERGREVAISSFAGKPIALNFWATWCPPCRREMPVLEAAQKAHPEFTFVFVNQAETLPVVRQFLAQQNLDLDNMFYDPGSQLSQESGASGLPTTIFFNADGSLAASHMGELSEASLAHYIKMLQKEIKNN